jgi:hypothetical protein
MRFEFLIVMNIMTVVYWDVLPLSPYQHFGTRKMEAAASSETVITICQILEAARFSGILIPICLIVWCHIPGVMIFRNSKAF